MTTELKLGIHSIAAASAVVLCLTFSEVTSAQEGPSVAVTECDVFAAHPDDPNRTADGVADEAIVPALAVEACRAAVASDGNDPRSRFQLGRALLAQRRFDEAAEEFRKASNGGHAVAAAYLGDALQHGEGAAVDYEKALAAYRLAEKGGFRRADELIAQMTFDPSLYSVGVMAQLYAGDYSGIGDLSRDEKRSWLTRSYVFSMTQAILGECDKALKATTIVPLYTYRYGGGWTADKSDVSVEIYDAVGERDAGIFLRRHGCEGPISKHVFASLNTFLSKFSE